MRKADLEGTNNLEDRNGKEGTDELLSSQLHTTAWEYNPRLHSLTIGRDWTQHVGTVGLLSVTFCGHSL
jgi:hypothetical protein